MMTPARNFYRGTNQPRWIIIHDLEYPEVPGAAEWAGSYFATDVPKSAHYTVDADSIVQSVSELDGAWHTSGYIQNAEVNRRSIGIEHAGYARQSASEWNDNYSRRMLERSAALVADIARRHHIPVRWLTPTEIRAGMAGIAGHHDFVIATGAGSHVDPGPAFPRDWYIGRVRALQGGGQQAPGVLTAVAIAAVAGATAYALLNPEPTRRFVRRFVPGW